jgi:hypothetical protein
MNPDMEQTGQIREIDSAFQQINEIKNIAVILEIEIGNINIDRPMDEIESSLLAIEKFLNKKL